MKNDTVAGMVEKHGEKADMAKEFVGSAIQGGARNPEHLFLDQ